MKNFSARLIGLGIILLSLCACSNPNHQSSKVINPAIENNDPYEGFNRYMFAVNDFLDMTVLRPVALTYKTITPKTLQDRVHDFLINLRMPLVAVNYALQGEGKKSADAFGRFFTNSTVGLLGFIDVAKDVGNPYDPTDYGITLAKWGTSEGPYIVWPIIGPSNARDTFGTIMTAATDPVNIYSNYKDENWIPPTRFAADGVDFRARNMDTIDDLKKNSVDYYAKVRSLYRQKRNSLISGDDAGLYDDEDFPEYSELPDMHELPKQ